MKNFINVLVFILLFLWQLPQNIIALIMLPFIGKLKLIKYENYCYSFQASKMNGGISLWNFIFLSDYSFKRETVIAHEYGHVIDSHLFGPLYLFIIGIPSLLNIIFKFNNCYYSFYTEKRANKNAGLGVDKLCRLYFLDKPDYNKNKK